MGTKKRRRRKFSAEFKAETVRLVRDSDKSVTAIARELDLTAIDISGLPGLARIRLKATVRLLP